MPGIGNYLDDRLVNSNQMPKSTQHELKIDNFSSQKEYYHKESQYYECED